MNPWVGIVLVLAILGSAFVILRHIERQHQLHPELLRKLMHMLMGLVSASFPWLFSEPWPVLLLAGGSLTLLALVRGGLSLTRSFSGVLHGVSRSSWGELFFPVSVAVLFVLAGEDPVLYTVPILILALADAVAALVGLRYGQTLFTTLEGNKSIEGAFAFIIVTLLCVTPALLLGARAELSVALMIGLLMGVVVMMFEAVAWRGLDNLFIPLASFALLERYLQMELVSLSLRLLVILALGLFLYFWRRRSTLDDSALFGALLVGYGAWAIGDIYWLLVPLTLFILANLQLRHGTGQRDAVHNVYALLGIALPAYAWLLLGRDPDAPTQFFAYAVAFAVHLTMISISRGHYQLPRLPVPLFVLAIVQGLAVLLLPFLLRWGWDDARLIPVVVIGTVAMITAGGGFLWLQPGLRDCPATPARWLRQGAISATVALLAWYAMQHGNYGDEWL